MIRSFMAKFKDISFHPGLVKSKMRAIQMIEAAILCKFYSSREQSMKIVCRNFKVKFRLDNLLRLTL